MAGFHVLILEINVFIKTRFGSKAIFKKHRGGSPIVA